MEQGEISEEQPNTDPQAAPQPEIAVPQSVDVPQILEADPEPFSEQAAAEAANQNEALSGSLQPDEPESQPDQPEYQSDRLETQADVLELQSSQPESQADVLEPQPSQPESQADALELQPSQPEPQSDQSELQPDQVEAQSEQLEPQVDQPEAQMDQPEPQPDQSEAQAAQPVNPSHTISHYVLLPLYAWGAADWDLEVIQPLLQESHPTVGFSLTEARLASRVTVVGGDGAISAEALDMLRAAGCKVERVMDDGTLVAS